MAVVVYKREHLDDYNNIQDISSFMYVHYIDDRQCIFMIYPITMIKQDAWHFSYCIGWVVEKMVLDVHFIPIVVACVMIVCLLIRILRTVPSVSSVLLFIPLFHNIWDYRSYVDPINCYR